MKRWGVIGTILLLLIGVPPTIAATVPAITGNATLVEWCSQAHCGTARFSGGFAGSIAGSYRLGTVGVAVTHTPLAPQAGGIAQITGGDWRLDVPENSWRGLPAYHFRGSVAGGTIVTNGDGTFTVTATLVLPPGSYGPGGTLSAGGVLNHNTFPPTLKVQLGP
jgi:hypothetical protein